MMTWRNLSAACLASALLAAAPGAQAKQDYGYDQLGRLVRVTHANGITTFYVYDSAGNRTLRSRGTSTTPPQPPSPPPQAVHDTALVQPYMNVNIGVLANDTGSGLTVISVSAVSDGSASVLGGASVSYTAPGYVGPQSVTYTVQDNQGRTANGVIEIEVFELIEPCNPPPGQICQIDPLG